jgi:hypothetical protein
VQKGGLVVGFEALAVVKSLGKLAVKHTISNYKYE